MKQNTMPGIHYSSQQTLHMIYRAFLKRKAMKEFLETSSMNCYVVGDAKGL